MTKKMSLKRFVIALGFLCVKPMMYRQYFRYINSNWKRIHSKIMNYIYGSISILLISFVLLTSSVIAKTIYDSNDIVIQEILPVNVKSIKMPDDYEESYNDMIEGISKEVITSDVENEDIISTSVVEPVKPKLSTDTIEVLQRVVEAEVTGEEWGDLSREELLLCKVRVAQVFINRANNPDFTTVSTLYDALTYPGASATLIDGRYYEVEVTDMTIEACNMALNPATPDYSAGALYFLGGSSKKCKWADNYLFTDEVGHSFFK